MNKFWLSIPTLFALTTNVSFANDVEYLPELTPQQIAYEESAVSTLNGLQIYDYNDIEIISETKSHAIVEATYNTSYVEGEKSTYSRRMMCMAESPVCSYPIEVQ